MKIAFVSAASSSHTVKWVNALCKRGHKVRLYSLPEHENRQKNLNPEVEVVYEFPLKSPVHKFLVAGNLKAADVVASTSEVMADQVRRVFGEQRKIWITPFGVDCSQFSPQPQEHDGFCVGAVKALEDVYGMDDLIRAFALFVQKAPPGSYSLKIYGKGSRQEALQQLIDSCGDVEALAEHLLRLCQDTALRSQMGEAGRERVLRLFDFKKNVEQMEQVYEAAIATYQKG